MSVFGQQMALSTTPRTTAQEQRRAKISRLRTRLANIEPDGTTDAGLDTIAVIGTIKGVIDVLADDGEDK